MHMDNRRIEYRRRLQRTYKKRTHGAREENESAPLTKQILPYDVLFLILLKLPNDSLARLNCVSKEFKAVISDPAFVALRKPSLIIQTPCRSVTTSTPYFKHFCIGFPKVEEIPLEMPKDMPMDPYLIGSCHGLLCFLGFKDAGRIHYVYNTLTKKWIASPPIQSSGKRFCVLYYKRSRGTYHLLTHVSRENSLSTQISDGQYKVHELGTSSWRALSKKNSPYVPLQCQQSTPVAMFGCLYWICLSNKRNESRMILAFNVETEQFSYIKEPARVSLPYSDSAALTLVEITDVGLGYPTFTECTMNIWVMKGRNRTWEKAYAVNLKPVQGSLETCWGVPSYVVLLCPVGEIWFSDHGRHTGGNHKLIIYDCNSRTFRSVEFPSLFPVCSTGVISYTPSLWKSDISLKAF